MPKTIRSRRPWSPLRAVSLATMCAAVSATALPPSDIFRRQSSSCAANFEQCTSAPANFCCPQGHACISLAGNTTVLCCPEGASCQRIERISCNVSLQDPAKNPGAKVKTTALQSALPRCKDECCPFGYTCTDDGNCERDRDQSKPPPVSTVSSSTTSPTRSPTSSRASTTISETSTSLPVPPTQTAGSTTGASENTETEASSSNNGPPVAVIGGVTAGAILAIILAVVIACVLVKRKSKPEKSPSLKLTRSSSSFGNIISNPIIVEGTAMRSDFNRGPPAKRGGPDDSAAAAGLAYRTSVSISPPSSSGSGSGSRNLTGNGLRQSSIAYGGPPPSYVTPPASRGNENPNSVLLPPRTPRQPHHQDREPSSVSINVFADPLTLTPESASNAAGVGGGGQNNPRRYSNMTTFTQLMDEADLGGVARGGTYVPYRPGTGTTPQGSPRR